MPSTEQAFGNVHSIQTLGTLDGPGVRFVVFMQGCNLRCGCCHNPETWELRGGSLYTAEMLVKKALRYEPYFGAKGGVTLTGGEPLVQAEFAYDFFAKSRRAGMDTCLDTSGSILNDKIKKLLSVTDRVMLDIKYATDELYREHVGCSINAPLEFLAYLDSIHLPTTIRQVVIPTLNDGEDNTAFLRELISVYRCIDKVELLPFKKLCTVKYESMGIPFPFEKYRSPTVYEVVDLEKELNSLIASRGLQGISQQ